MVIGTALTVADVTDWLEEFSGPDGQSRLTDQGKIGLVQITGEAVELEGQVHSILIAGSGNPDLIGTIDDLLALLPPSTPEPDAGKLSDAALAVERAAVPAQLDLLTEGGKRLAIEKLLDARKQLRILQQQSRDAGDKMRPAVGGAPLTATRQAQLDALDRRRDAAGNGLTSVESALSSVRALVSSAPRPTRFQRFVIEGERGVSAGTGPDLTRLVKRVVSEAFARTPVSLGGKTPYTGGTNGTLYAGGTSWTPYTALGIGPVPLYSTNGASPSAYQTPMPAAGFAGQISVEQAVLQQQIGPAISAALDTLQRVQPLAQTIDFARFEALRSSVSSDLNALLVEANRTDGPRKQRVDFYRAGLASHFSNLEDAAKNPVDSTFDSNDEESRRAALTLLHQQIATINALWDSFFPPTGTPPVSFTDTLIIAQRLLESVASSTQDWIELMDSIGFTLDERRIARIDPPTEALVLALGDADVTERLETLEGYLSDLADLVAA
jgi:hypothetical protein